MSSSNTPIDLSQETPKSTSKHVPERTPGTTMLPLARIKRVIKEDKDVSLINAEATFCIAYATELFMEYLVTEAFSKAKKEKRKTVYYKDLASTVKESDQLEFLEDVIPTTMTLKDAMAKRKENVTDDTAPSTPPAKKQKTTAKSTSKSDAASSTATTNATTHAESTTVLSDEEDEEEEDEEDVQVPKAETKATDVEQPATDNEIQSDTKLESMTAAQDQVDQDDTMMEEDPK
ncbi:histone-fold-containing protein [Mucor ambiguus]|uniref:Histone-fold-containing protein n=1 Tax=Mucor ambiguus TaxID=91626 RepID=A0A0C9MD65_9FUNG|nr:histone-fold-containing protein [Mucor ambiguus]